MKKVLQPRVVVVTRATEFEELLARHGTREQARFFLSTRDQNLDEVFAWHEGFHAALHTVQQAIPRAWRRSRVDRSDLDRFLFDDLDVVVAVGQDGLVANVAKYLRSQLVIGVNPDPTRLAGVLVPHTPERGAALLEVAGKRAASDVEERTMVRCDLDDGQQLVALNEIYLGQRTHQSSRYRIHFEGVEERQSSSGIIVTTGTGATGWARSIHRGRHTSVTLPAPTDPALAFFVREAWPSPWTGAELTDGLYDEDDALLVTSEMNDTGVIFGDGIEDDHLNFSWGQRARIHTADFRLNLLHG